MLELYVRTVFVDSSFDPVLDVFRVVSVSWIVRSNRHDGLRQQVVVPIKHIKLQVTDYPMWSFNSQRVTSDAYRCLLIDFFHRCERCCDMNVIRSSHDTTAVAIVIIIFSVIIVPRRAVITLVNWNICPVDTEELAERYLLGKLVD